MTISQILANDVKSGRLGFSAAVHRLADISASSSAPKAGMDLLTAKRLIHEAMCDV